MSIGGLSWVDLLSWLLIASGGFFCLTTGLGLLRLPDFFSRLNGASCMDAMGAGLLLLGCALQAPGYLVVVKLGFIYLFLLVTNAVAAHALARSALSKGMEPLLGSRRYGNDEASR
ncbi:monovalent cation/H(+) antiporter subunit G [Gammaproteobacteria bacterium]|nr:monovalent cation/H(+) antiporter subunit G [Gammaproteobacteria bacterium]